MENRAPYNEQKPDWKQWIPIYGIYKTGRDADNGKPSMLDNHPLLAVGYHSAITGGVIIGAILVAIPQLEKILK